MEMNFYPNWKDKVAFGEDGPAPTVLVEGDKVKVALVGLKAGQEIPPHPAEQGNFIILQGSATMTVGDEEFPVEAGATIIVPDDVNRGFVAKTELVFIAVRVS